MDEPRTRAELLEAVNALLRETSAQSVGSMPPVKSLDGLVERVRTLLQVIEEYEIEHQRQTGEVAALQAALAFAQRAWAQEHARHESPRDPAPAEESWPEMTRHQKHEKARPALPQGRPAGQVRDEGREAYAALLGAGTRGITDTSR